MPMKKFIAGVVLGMMMAWGVVFAAPSVDHNGVFWKKLSNPAKAGYINGYSDAMQVSTGKLEVLTSAADLFHWKGANKIIRQISSELSTSDLTPDKAVKKLDSLYANPKYSELDLGQALQYLGAQPAADPNVASDSARPVTSGNTVEK